MSGNSDRSLAAGRRHGGKPWKKGQSGNPSGRAKLPKELKAKIRDLCPKAVRWWAGVLSEPERYSESIVEKVAATVMDRGYGRAPQAMTLTVRHISDDELEAEIQRRLLEAGDDDDPAA